MARCHPWPQRNTAPAAGEEGFLLPLALCGALVLLLSSLSLSAAALQARQRQGAQRSRHQVEDQLASAAHSLAAALQGPYRCLLSVPSSQWQALALPPGCPTGLDPNPLRRIAVGNAEVLLQAWQPDGSGGGGELLLQLGERGPQSRYSLRLEAAIGLQEVG